MLRRSGHVLWPQVPIIDTESIAVLDCLEQLKEENAKKKGPGNVFFLEAVTGSYHNDITGFLPR